MAKRILLVEDEADIQQIYTTILEDSGFKVDQVTEGIDAVTKLKDQKEAYDIILLDIMMPQLNGIQILDQIKKATSIHKDTPVIIISNLDQQDIVKEALGHGAKEYIIKAQIVPSDLITLINNYL